jgi:UDP-N-acetyl-D-mannosaminuronic acid dehydrogenase
MARTTDIVVIGGGGHIGLPLALTLAKTRRILVCDTDATRLQLLRRGKYPHHESGAQELLATVHDRLTLAENLVDCGHCRTVIIATYEVTPVLIEQILYHLRQTQLIVVRSTVPIGTTRALMAAAAESLGRNIHVAYCPERSIEGESLREMQLLPQLVGCDHVTEFARIRRLLRHAPSFVRLTPEEAEAVKLTTNMYRFAHFALANQLYLSLLEQGLDPHRVFRAAKHEYPRMSSLPNAGLVGGPCLRKDSLLFMNGSRGKETILEAALRTNDGMARRLIDVIRQAIPLRRATVGLLGYAFKAGSDDSRWSPAKELANLLAAEAHSVLCTDPYVDNLGLPSLDEVVERSDVLIVVTPHSAFREITVPGTKIIVDPWGVLLRDARHTPASLAIREMPFRAVR